MANFEWNWILSREWLSTANQKKKNERKCPNKNQMKRMRVRETDSNLFFSFTLLYVSDPLFLCGERDTSKEVAQSPIIPSPLHLRTWPAAHRCECITHMDIIALAHAPFTTIFFNLRRMPMPNLCWGNKNTNFTKRLWAFLSPTL